MATATIAHEGNPRTDSLVVTGTLDGTVTVTLGPVPTVPPTVENPSEPPSGVPKQSPSNALKYVFADFVFGEGRASVPTIVNPGNTATPSTTAPGGSVLEYSRNNDINCWGCIVSPSRSQVTDERVLPKGQKHQFVRFSEFLNVYYNSTGVDSAATGYIPDATIATYGRLLSVTGAPISGPAVGVDPNSTFDDFTGYALLYNSILSQLQLCFYNHQSLSTIPTPLATETTVPSTGQYLVLRYLTTNHFSSTPATITITVYNAAGASVFSSAYSDGVEFAFPATENHFRQYDSAAWVNVSSGHNGSGNTDDFWTWDLIETGWALTSSGHLP